MDARVEDRSAPLARHALVGTLANSALSQLAGRRFCSPEDHRVEAQEVLYRAALALPAPDPRDFLTPSVSRYPVFPCEDLHDHQIGTVARRLGEDWIADRLSFADVARASAWLYALSKLIGQRFPLPPRATHPCRVLLATTQGESHLIGPSILAQKLRRTGHSVQLYNHAEPEAIARRCGQGEFDGIMLSVSTGRGLVKAEEVVRRIQQGSCAQIPIVLGGAVLDFCKEEAAQIGANLVTNDEMMGLKAFGWSEGTALGGTSK